MLKQRFDAIDHMVELLEAEIAKNTGFALTLARCLPRVRTTKAVATFGQPHLFACCVSRPGVSSCKRGAAIAAPLL